MFPSSYFSGKEAYKTVLLTKSFMLFVDTRLNITFIIFLSQCDEFWFFSINCFQLTDECEDFSLQINFLFLFIDNKNTDSNINKTDWKTICCPFEGCRKTKQRKSCILQRSLWIWEKSERDMDTSLFCLWIVNELVLKKLCRKIWFKIF